MHLRKTIRHIGRRIERAAESPYNTFKSLKGAFKGVGGGGGMGGDQSYTPAMQDVARSRAAGSGVVNYTDRTPGGK